VQRVFALIREEAERYGVPIVGSEVVGLVCQDALVDVAEHALRLESFSRDQILENRLARRAGAAEQALPEFLDEVASAAPTPGGGSVSAVAGALAAALASMVARLTIGKKKYADAEGRMREAEAGAEACRRELLELAAADARAFEAYRAAGRMSARTPEETATRARAMADAALAAAEVPLRTAEACVGALEWIQAVAEAGNENAVSDAGVAAWLARAGAEGAALNVRINLPSVSDAERDSLTKRARQVVERARALHGACVDHVERRLPAPAAV